MFAISMIFFGQCQIYNAMVGCIQIEVEEAEQQRALDDPEHDLDS